MASLAAFQAARELQPTHLGAQLEVANCLRDLGRLDEAAAVAQRAIAGHPKAPAPYISLGLLKRRLGEPAAALAAFEAAIAVVSDHPGAHIELANELRAAGQIERADAIIEYISRRRPDVAGVQAALGALRRRQGDHHAALAAFRAAVSIDPNFVGAHVDMATELRELGELDQAESVLREVLSRRPRTAAAWVSIALIARRRGDHKAALAAFTAAANIEPGNIGTELERVNELRSLGRFSEAEEILSALIRSHPNHPAALKCLAELKRTQGDRLCSLATFQSAGKLDPADVRIKVEIANDLRELKRYAEAEVLLQQALSSHPNDSRVLGAMGHLKRRQGDRSGSLATFEAAVAADPNNLYLQLECANDLRDLGRFAEAEKILQRLICEQPNEASPLVTTALLYRRRGDRAAALEAFRAAAARAPTNTTIQIEIAHELRELGQLDEASRLLEQLLAKHADDTNVVIQQLQVLRRQNKRTESLERLKALCQRVEPSARILVEMAADELALGHPDEAIALNKRAFDLEPDNLAALLQAYHLAAIEDNWEDAEAICEKTIGLHPGASAPRLNAARAAFELGRREEAFARIHETRDRLGALPEILMRELELLQMLRDWKAVRNVAVRARASEAGAGFAALAHLVQAEIHTGNFDRARAELSAMMPSGAMERSLHLHLAGLLAEAKLQQSRAAAHFRSAIALNPTDPNLHLDLARLSLITLDLDGCQEALKAFTSLTQSSALRRGLSPKIMQNFVGQLFDEFRLDSEALKRTIELRTESDDRQLRLLRELVTDYPDYTAGAIIATILLRKTGAFEAPIDPRGPAIPKQIVQYWDRSPPPDITDLMKTWRDKNPSFEWLCIDDDAAESFLQANYPPKVSEAYKSAHQPAQKADVFRLAWLAEKGGVYVDADDACSEPIEGFLPAGASFAVYQENYGSIANNFIAAIPGHPVIVAALEQAVEAVLRDDHDIVWLSSGPGLLTRAFARQWAMSDDPAWLRSAYVMTLGEVQRFVAIHCHARYKSTMQSWTRASFTRKLRRRVKRAASVG